MWRMLATLLLHGKPLPEEEMIALFSRIDQYKRYIPNQVPAILKRIISQSPPKEMTSNAKWATVILVRAVHSDCERCRTLALFYINSVLKNQGAPIWRLIIAKIGEVSYFSRVLESKDDQRKKYALYILWRIAECLCKYSLTDFFRYFSYAEYTQRLADTATATPPHKRARKTRRKPDPALEAATNWVRKLCDFVVPDNRHNPALLIYAVSFIFTIQDAANSIMEKFKANPDPSDALRQANRIARYVLLKGPLYRNIPDNLSLTTHQIGTVTYLLIMQTNEIIKQLHCKYHQQAIIDLIQSILHSAPDAPSKKKLIIQVHSLLANSLPLNDIFNNPKCFHDVSTLTLDGGFGAVSFVKLPNKQQLAIKKIQSINLVSIGNEFMRCLQMKHTDLRTFYARVYLTVSLINFHPLYVVMEAFGKDLCGSKL